MGTKDHLLIHRPQESGCRMWSPIIPPAVESQPAAARQAPSSDKPSVFSPEGLKPALGDKVIFVP